MLRPHDSMDVEVFMISIQRYDGFLPISELQTEAWKLKFGLSEFHTRASIKFLIADKAIEMVTRDGVEGYVFLPNGEYRMSIMTKTGYSADEVRERKLRWEEEERWMKDRTLMKWTFAITIAIFAHQIGTQIFTWQENKTQQIEETKPTQEVKKPHIEKQIPILKPATSSIDSFPKPIIKSNSE